MSQVIRVSDELYDQLASLAEGFDTPNNVIQRLLDFYERGGESTPKASQPTSSLTNVPAELEIVFSPPSEERFKRELLQQRKACVRLHKVDGSVETKIWNANRLSQSSSVLGNLRSGLLRGWKKKGIVKAEVSISPE
jgi:predicted CopG family antitoxin